jgi:hypothetical protein
MAKRRRRRIGLAGSPAEHLRETREAITWVGKKVRHMQDALKGGQCSSALFGLTNARRELGRAQGALVGNTGWEGDKAKQRKRLLHHIDRLDRVLFNVSQKFLSTCGHKKG